MNKRKITKLLIGKKIHNWTTRKKFLRANVTLVEMGKELEINRTYLSNFINETYNKNFNGWINELRIGEAKKLIMNYPHWPLSIIGEKVGFADLAHFSKQFKIAVGVNPSTWKKEMEANEQNDHLTEIGADSQQTC